MPNYLGNRLSRVLQDGEVGLFVLNVDEEGQIHGNGINTVVQTGKKSFTSTLSHLRSFSQYVVELQACQVRVSIDSFLKSFLCIYFIESHFFLKSICRSQVTIPISLGLI